jgi:hypothetical protein
VISPAKLSITSLAPYSCLMGKFVLTFTVYPARVMKILSGIAILIILLGIVSIPLHDRNIGTKFDMDFENSVPTYFSSLILFFAAAILAVIASIKKKRQEASWTQWGLLGIIFLLLSLEEVASFHEDLAKGINKMIGLQGEGPAQYVWGAIGMMVLLAFGAYYFRFWLQLPFKTRRRFLIAAVVFAGGALGVEVITGYTWFRYGTEHIYYKLLVVVEEAMEIGGTLLFIHALLFYLFDLKTHVREESQIPEFS